MNESDPLNGLRNKLKKLKNKGQTVVPIDEVQKQLDSVSNMSLEMWKEKCRREQLHYQGTIQNSLAEYQATEQCSIENFKAAVAAGQAALKSAILTNGGAAVATLAFVGSLVQHGTPIHGFNGVLFWFAVGTLLGAIASGGTYLAQSAQSYIGAHSYTKMARLWNMLVISCIIFSYAAFFGGCLTAYIKLCN